MADYIYSELINNLVSLNFDGVSNENAEIRVDNLHRLIEAIIKKTPGSLTIVDPSGRESIFDGSQDISITLSDRHLKSVKVTQCEKDNTPIEGLLVGDYYFDFEMIDRGNGYIYHLYCSAKVLTSLVDDEKERAINRENEIERNLNQEIARAQQEEINLNNYIDSAISSVYKAQGSATVSDLNSLTVTKEMNGYVYDISDNGILTKGSIQVINGDNVIIIWNENETDWKWDKLSGIVDLSNYATKPYVNQGLNSKVDLSSDQTITGVKRFSNMVYIGNYDNDYISITNGDLSIRATNSLVLRSGNNNIIPYTNNSIDLGSSTSGYKDLYLNGKVDFGTKVSGRTNTSYITTDQYDGIGFFVNGSKIVNIYDNIIYFAKSAIPSASSSFDLGSNSNLFKDLYLSGNAYASSFIAKNSSTNVSWNVSSNQYSNMQFERNGAPIFSMSGQAFFPNSDNQRDLGTNDLKFRDLYLSGNVILSSANANYKLLADGAWFDIKRDNTTVFQFYDTIIKSPKDNYADLGVSGNRWKNLYLAGNISDGTNSVSVSDITSSTFNVINASDIVNNTLTQEQYDLITNGKPTLIKGTILDYTHNLYITNVAVKDNGSCSCIGTCFYSTNQNSLRYVNLSISTTKVISIVSVYLYGIQSIETNELRLGGKNIPAYPSNTGTFNLKQIDGTLTWTKEWYGTQAEYDALGTYDNNTIYNIIEE